MTVAGLRDLIRISDGTKGESFVPGIASPVPGLALTEPLRDDDRLGEVVVTLTPTGHGVAWFSSAEAAAGFILAIGALTDWTTFDTDSPDYHDVMVRVLEVRSLWGGNGKPGYRPVPSLKRGA